MDKILVSKCLIGENVKYNGGNNSVDNPHLQKWLAEGRVVAVCPEYEGGLPVPRPASEILGGRVVNISGDDVTKEFICGADIALAKAKQNGIKYALLKQGSPSCGSKMIYDGTFTGTKIAGMGVAAGLLDKNGIEIFDETQINELARLIDEDVHTPQYVKKVMDCLASCGYEAYMVGGCVRDSIMGHTPNDYDVTTNATPEQMMECFADFRVIPTGLQHGTVTVLSDGNNIEVTTYRIDGEYADNRHPRQVTFTSRLEDDLARRDFTVNAMAMDADGNVCDPFGGMEDLKNGIIRCVGDAAVRFAEDGLRILRCIRFASVLGFEVEADTAAKVHQCRRLLDNISKERIMSELQKLLCGKAAADVCNDYSDVLETIIPQLRGNTAQLAQRLARACPDVYARLALLLCDLGADEAGVALRRLKCDNITHSTVKLLISNSHIPRDADRIAVKKYLAHMGNENFELLTYFIEALNGGDWSHLRTAARDIAAEGCCLRLSDLAINGTDVCAIGAKGTQTGIILKKLLDSVICETLPNSRDILIDSAKELLDELRNV